MIASLGRSLNQRRATVANRRKLNGSAETASPQEAFNSADSNYKSEPRSLLDLIRVKRRRQRLERFVDSLHELQTKHEIDKLIQTSNEISERHSFAEYQAAHADLWGSIETEDQLTLASQLIEKYKVNEHDKSQAKLRQEHGYPTYKKKATELAEKYKMSGPVLERFVEDEWLVSGEDINSLL